MSSSLFPVHSLSLNSSSCLPIADTSFLSWSCCFHCCQYWLFLHNWTELHQLTVQKCLGWPSQGWWKLPIWAVYLAYNMPTSYTLDFNLLLTNKGFPHIGEAKWLRYLILIFLKIFQLAGTYFGLISAGNSPALHGKLWVPAVELCQCTLIASSFQKEAD